MIAQFAIGGALIPFVTILFRERGLTYGEISLVFLGGALLATFLPSLWGMLADKYIAINRLFAMLNAGSVVALSVFAFQHEFFPILLSYLTFALCFQPTLHLINALCYHYLHDPKAQFGTLRAWGSFGWIIPSAIVFSALTLSPGAGVHFTPFVAIGCAILAGAFSLALPAATPGGESRNDTTHSAPYREALATLLRNPDYLVVLFAFFLIASSFTALVLFSPPFLEERGVPVRWIGPIQSVGVVFEVIALPSLKHLLKTRGYLFSLLLGSGCLLVRHALYLFVDNLWILSLSYILAGMVIVYFHIAASLLVNEIAAPSVRATAQTLMVTLGSGLGPVLLFTATWKVSAGNPDNLQGVFAIATAIAGVAFLLIALRGRRLDHAASAARAKDCEAQVGAP